ncbi:MAG: hypothetical protein EOO88_21285 [Pedobacter sp.]|nr:MAG: hypothetical protein EOO88_21285 [Pedobacter sp.]
MVAQTVFDVATAGLSSGITNALSDKAFFTGVAAAGYAGLAVGFIKNTVAAYKNSNCGCGSPVPPACATPDGLRLLVDGCSLTHYFQVIGGGTDAGNFHYSVQNGSLPEYNNASSITFTNTRLIKVTQNDPNTPILLTATVACPNGNVPYYSQSYDLYGITRNPEPISLDGAVNINFNDPSDWIYTAGNGGSNTSNTNNKLIWSRNYAGRTVSGGNDNDNFIKIHWTYRTNTAKVYLQSQNQCSGVSVYRDLSVNVY